MTVEEHKRVARRAFDALMADNLTSVEDIVTPDAVLHQCGFLDPIPVSAMLAGQGPRPRLRDRNVELLRVIGEGDLVALHWETVGRNVDSDAPELDGKWVRFPSMSILRFEQDRIAEIWNIQDVSTRDSILRSEQDSGGTGGTAHHPLPTRQPPRDRCRDVLCRELRHRRREAAADGSV